MFHCCLVHTVLPLTGGVEGGSRDGPSHELCEDTTISTNGLFCLEVLVFIVFVLQVPLEKQSAH